VFIFTYIRTHHSAGPDRRFHPSRCPRLYLLRLKLRRRLHRLRDHQQCLLEPPFRVPRQHFQFRTRPRVGLHILYVRNFIFKMCP
jgi:hypothetical protein